MKKKALLKILAVPEDLTKLQGVLDALQAKGVDISEDNGGMGKKDLVLVVLSESFYRDEVRKSRLFDRLAAGAENILPLNLEEMPVPDEIMNLLFARNIITASGRSQEQLAERILSAIPEKKNPMTGILVGAVAVLALLGGIFLWNSMKKPEAEPAMAVEAPIPNPLGITEEELAAIKDVVIIGDYFGYYTYNEYSSMGHWPEIWDYAYEVVDNGETHWYSNQDGHEFTLTRYEDLRFLELMPNLTMLRMVLVDVDAQMLPDLSNAGNLQEVSIRNCSMSDISWLAGNNITTLEVYETNIEDFSPLTDCSYLSTVTIDGRGKHRSDFGSFAPPYLSELNLRGMEAGADLNGLAACPNLRYLRVSDLPIRNVDFLKELPALHLLELRDLPQLQDISGVSSLKELTSLGIIQCEGVRDYMPISACKALTQLQIDRWDWMYVDSAFLNGLTNLSDIGLFGLNLNNMEFLATVNQKYGLSLGFCGDIQDYSGLAYIQRYQWIHVNPRNNGGRFGDFSLVAPYLQNASIANMELYNCTNVDLAKLPEVSGKLTITRGDLENLAGLHSTFLQHLELKDMQYLRSLKGIDGLTKLANGQLELSILGCIRMLDYSALDGSSLRALNLGGMYVLPDFSRFSLFSLRLESIEDLEDLTCLETLSKDGIYHFEFPGLNDLKDLSVLRQFKGNSLYVPPQVADQAAELVADGNFHYYEVRYPDSGWMPMNEEVVLLSLEDLETLPKAVLRRVSTVWIAGDEIIDPNRYEIWDTWKGNRTYALLHDRKTNQERLVKAGNITDFSLLADLTGLRELRLFNQPLTNLEGIQNLAGLSQFEAGFCPDLVDVSAAYTLQSLEMIFLRDTGITSIQGVQNLPRLRELHLFNTQVSDLSPLLECDFSYAAAHGGFILLVGNTPIEDFSPLAVIPSFGHLNICGHPAENWVDYVAEANLRTFCGPLGSDEILKTFVQQHPELEDLQIERGYELTDLTPLLELEKLRYVHIWDRADKAANSLKGLDRRFELTVD